MTATEWDDWIKSSGASLRFNGGHGGLLSYQACNRQEQEVIDALTLVEARTALTYLILGAVYVDTAHKLNLNLNHGS